MTEDAVGRARAVRLMVFDVDGVMTDGRLYMSNSGEEMKAFHILDGQGVKMLRESGVEVALLTARRSQIVARRAAELGIARVCQGVSDKRSAFDALLSECRLDRTSAGFAGDDLVDLPVLTCCGFAASVPHAPEAVRSRVHYITRAGGGEGAVREICEYVMRAQDTLERAIAAYLRK
jgi:3-deoxy-D-manno-octulosonate 8-phosphate phosphatase (KDO 8-P phosphatase)